MEILKRLSTPDDDEDPADIRLWPCQFCDEMFDDDDTLLAVQIDIVSGTGRVTKYIHPICIVEAAEKIKANGLHLETSEHMADIAEVDNVLADV